jgi:hypothetical protein
LTEEIATTMMFKAEPESDSQRRAEVSRGMDGRNVIGKVLSIYHNLARHREVKSSGFY